MFSGRQRDGRDRATRKAVDVTTHLRARTAQAGALLALIVGGVAAAPAVALAAPSSAAISGFSLSPTDVLAGGQIQLQYTVTNNSGGQSNQATIKVTGMSCSGDCSQVIEIDNSKQFSAKLTAPQVAAGATQNVTVNVSVTIGNDPNGAQQQAQVTVRGPDKPQTVTAITGKVKGSDGKAISGAAVAARDSSGNTFQATTNGSGAFSINSSDNHPIAPGDIAVAAGKTGYVSTNVDVQGVAGKSVNVPLTLKLDAATASASPSVSASVEPSAPGAALDTTVPSAVANLPSNPAAKDASQNSSSGSTLFIVLGGLLVAAGVGAIVLVLMRRRNAGGNNGDDGPDPTAMGGGPGVMPPSQGRFNDATRVASPVGAGPAGATMVAPRSGAPSMSDAPTMLQRPVPPVEDEFPDPYGAPLPQQGGYLGTPAGGWDNQAGGAYGAPNQYGPAEDDYAGGQYGAGTGGYGDQYGAAAGAPAVAGPAAGGPERYDEHTSLYRPESDQDGYGDYGQGGYGAAGDAGQYGAGQSGAAYGGGAAGAGQYGGTYGGGAAGGGQYGAGNAAGAGQYGGGAYGGGADDDYRSGAGYQGAGGYGQEPADQGGYGPPAGGIDSGNGYGPQPGGPAGGQYGGGAYGGGAAAGAGGYGGGQQYGGGYDEHGGYEQGYDQPGAAGYAGGEYGPANGQAPQQYGGGYDQYDEQNNAGYNGGRRSAGGYDDQQQQQPSRRGAPRRPNDY
jgi:hypothetical protein